ncbi:MAG: hypothetical protein L3J89_02175 [Gammaproteobacteria bacterium]|nr:hypothetical protein [Gammaproteobacteria bacterium]
MAISAQIKLITLSIISLTLAACSGSSTPAASTPSPTAVSTYSISGSVNISPNTGLTLQNNSGDTLMIGGVSFEFSTALPDGSDYNITVSNQPSGQNCSIANGSGIINGTNIDNILLSCSSWGTAMLIENNDTGLASTPQITIDTVGNAIAVWAQSDGTRTSIWTNRYTAGGTWGNPELIETDDAGNAVTPQIAVDGSGNALAVWSQSDGDRNNIWANRYTAGGAWGTAQMIETDNANSATAPQITVNDSGDAMAVWQQIDGSGISNIWANHYASASTWGTAETIEFNTRDAITPQVTMDTNGNAIAIWSQDDSFRFNIQTNRYTAGSGWNPYTQLLESIQAGSAETPQVAFDSAGNAIAAWSHYDGSRYSIWTNRYTAGAPWSIEKLIENHDISDARAPQIITDANNNAQVIWTHAAEGAIRANHYTAATDSWEGDVLVSGDISEITNGVQAATDSSGNAIVLWSQTSGGGAQMDIWVSHYVTGNWSTAILIESDSTGAAVNPQIATGSNGDTIAVWSQMNGSMENIWFNRVE